jgi:hypothetical protein
MESLLSISDLRAAPKRIDLAAAHDHLQEGDYPALLDCEPLNTEESLVMASSSLSFAKIDLVYVTCICNICVTVTWIY